MKHECNMKRKTDVSTQDRKKISKESNEVQTEEVKLEKSNNSPLTAVKEKVRPKPAGFWSKKLQALEERVRKNEQGEPYDFSCTDDSGNLNKRKKKPHQKRREQKKRQLIKPKYKKSKENTDRVQKPIKKTVTQPLVKKENLINRERTKVTDKHKSFTSAIALQATALTSTPAVNRENLVNPSNFLFLSPITKEETEFFNGVYENLPTKPTYTDSASRVKHFDQETPKIETRLGRISCRRVLRSGRMLRT